MRRFYGETLNKAGAHDKYIDGIMRLGGGSSVQPAASYKACQENGIHKESAAVFLWHSSGSRLWVKPNSSFYLYTHLCCLGWNKSS